MLASSGRKCLGCSPVFSRRQNIPAFALCAMASVACILGSMFAGIQLIGPFGPFGVQQDEKVQPHHGQGNTENRSPKERSFEADEKLVDLRRYSSNLLHSGKKGKAMADWQERFDRLLKAMSQGEPHKASARKSASAGQASGAEPDACSSDTQTRQDTSEDASR